MKGHIPSLIHFAEIFYFELHLVDALHRPLTQKKARTII